MVTVKVASSCLKPVSNKLQWANMQAQSGLSRWGVIRQARGACQAFCWTNVWPPGRLGKLCVNLTCQQQAQHQGEEHACGLHLTQHRRRLTALTRDLALGWPHSWVQRTGLTSWGGDDSF